MWAIIGVMVFIILLLAFWDLWVTLALLAFTVCVGAFFVIGIPLIISIVSYSKTHNFGLSFVLFIGLSMCSFFIVKKWFNS